MSDEARNPNRFAVCNYGIPVAVANTADAAAEYLRTLALREINTGSGSYSIKEVTNVEYALAPSVDHSENDSIDRDRDKE